MFNNSLINSATLPMMIIRNLVPLPNNEIRFDVANVKSKLALKSARDNDKYIVLFLMKNPNINNKDELDYLFETGLVCELLSYIDTDIANCRLIGVTRCKLNEVSQREPFYMASITTLPAMEDLVSEEADYVNLLVSELEKNAKQIFKDRKDIISLLGGGVTADKLCDILAYNTKFNFIDKVKYLQTPSVSMRIKYLVEDFKRQDRFNELDRKIEDEVRKSINDSQREYYLREKMKAIQNELGDKARKEEDIEKLREKIEKAKMPKEIKEKAMQELNRYISSGSISGEANVIRSYLDFMISLPWGNMSEDNKDINVAKDILDSGHYGLETVKDRILEYLAVGIMTGKNPQAILCLVGPPGVGKTSLAKSIAEALNKRFVKQSLGGVKDEAEIRGHRRTYIGALPGRILQGMVKAKTNNPVFLLDEVDKLSSDFRGDPSSALLEVLDGEQNRYFSDHYLEEPYDLSHVFFIATANYLENVPAALRDRMEIVELSSYTEYEKFEIAKRHLIDKQLNLHGLSKVDFNLEDEAILKIIREYTMESGVRELERLIGTLIRKAIKAILMKKYEHVTITDNNLSEWLGKPKFNYNKIDSKPQIGVVTGLAYTQYGGDTLPVEVTYYKGSGHIVLTGKLGDVMKESAQAALSYVKSNAKKYEIDESLFTNNDIHIHVPEGAVPKDGPSAGVTMTTAIISAFAHHPVDNLLGMTGEITLRGRVLPIGGLREKSIAAHRSGLKKIIIPKENVRDIEDIPESVRNDLEIIPVDNIDEVVNIAFI